MGLYQQCSGPPCIKQRKRCTVGHPKRPLVAPAQLDLVLGESSSLRCGPNGGSATLTACWFSQSPTRENNPAGSLTTYLPTDRENPKAARSESILSLFFRTVSIGRQILNLKTRVRIPVALPNL